jgi:GrpB-like predicted nucleotidyltransferase (UPF0157 family)
MRLQQDGHGRWRELYTGERERLLSDRCGPRALGSVLDGGIVEAIEQIGATSVPGLPAQPCVDIGLAVVPFPPTSIHIDALNALGYAPIPRKEGAPDQRFRHRTQPVQLLLVEAGSNRWTDSLIMRDFLRHDLSACREYTASKLLWATGEDYETLKADYFPTLLAQAQRWWIDHHGFGPVEAVAQELADFPHPWYISSGWALDLLIGQVTRVHHDVDVVIARAHQLDLQAYMRQRGWRFVTPLDGRLEPWPWHMRLERPRHQVHAHREGSFIDFLLTDMDHGVWRYRREPTIVQTVERIGLQSEQAIPFLAPELVLLFKSRNAGNQDRPQDQADFERVLPHLSAARRSWLRWALLELTPPHPWIKDLE